MFAFLVLYYLSLYVAVPFYALVLARALIINPLRLICSGTPPGVAFKVCGGIAWSEFSIFCKGFGLAAWIYIGKFITDFDHKHPLIYKAVCYPAKLLYGTFRVLVWTPLVGVFSVVGSGLGFCFNKALSLIRSRRALFLLAGFGTGVIAGIAYATLRKKTLRNRFLKPGRLESKTAFSSSVALAARSLASVALFMGAGMCLVDSTMSIAAAIPFATIYNIIDRIFSKKERTVYHSDNGRVDPLPPRPSDAFPASIPGIGFAPNPDTRCSTVTPCCGYVQRELPTAHLIKTCDCACHDNPLMNS